MTLTRRKLFITGLAFRECAATARQLNGKTPIASSPTEPDVRLGVRFSPLGSSFKEALFSMQPGKTIVASQLSGDFTLPRDTSKKLLFIAGGIGVTPFRSMLQYLLDAGEKRPIAILYANNAPTDVAYRDLLERAQRELGIGTVYVFSELSPELIASEVPDYRERTCYISGPQGMVLSFKRTLRGMGVARRSIRTDYFPGFT